MAGTSLISPLAFQNSGKVAIMTPPAQTKPSPAKFEIAPLTQEQLAQALTYLLKVCVFFVCLFLLCFFFDCFGFIALLSNLLKNITPLYQPISCSETVSLTSVCDRLENYGAPLSTNQSQFLRSGHVDNSLSLAKKYHGTLLTNQLRSCRQLVIG